MYSGASQTSALALAAILLLGASACGKKTVQMPDLEPTATRVETQQPTPAQKAPEPTPPAELRDIYFDFDQSKIRGDAMAVLNANGKILLSESSTRMKLEGHCDERGTVEYNLALGDRRARAAKDYLVSYGVEASRLSTVSYGEERPFVQGHDESAWSQNRRVHFVRETGAQASR